MTISQRFVRLLSIIVFFLRNIFFHIFIDHVQMTNQEVRYDYFKKINTKIGIANYYATFYEINSNKRRENCSSFLLQFRE